MIWQDGTGTPGGINGCFPLSGRFQGYLYRNAGPACNHAPAGILRCTNSCRRTISSRRSWLNSGSMSPEKIRGQVTKLHRSQSHAGGPPRLPFCLSPSRYRRCRLLRSQATVSAAGWIDARPEIMIPLVRSDKAGSAQKKGGSTIAATAKRRLCRYWIFR